LKKEEVIRRKPKKKKSTLRSVLNWAGNIFLALVIILVAFVLITSKGFGWQYNTVMSGSMEPTLNTKGLVVSYPVSAESIKAGDIITFIRGGEKVTHRVAEVYIGEDGNSWFETKGDANNTPDPDPVSANGKVNKVIFHIPRLGSWVHFLQGRGGIIILDVLAVVLIILLARYAYKGLREKKEKEKKQIRKKRIIK
jgi:signal peptidase